MSTIPSTLPRDHYLNADYGLKSWLLTLDHKRIAILYLVSITLFFFLGGAMAVLIRLELLTPAADVVQSDTYNKLFTMHGLIMIFFFLVFLGVIYWSIKADKQYLSKMENMPLDSYKTNGEANHG